MTVLHVSGNADKRTSLFTLHGVQTNLTHTVTDTSGFGSIVGAIYVLDEGTNLSVDGGIPDVIVTEPSTDSTEPAPIAGRYHLQVSAANAHWTVTIQEHR